MAIRAARQFLNCVAVEIAGRKIHFAERARGGKSIVDEADLLEQIFPIDLGNKTQAGDDIANRNIRAALSPMDIANDRVGCSLLRGQTLIEPSQRGRNTRILVA